MHVSLWSQSVGMQVPMNTPLSWTKEPKTSPHPKWPMSDNYFLILHSDLQPLFLAHKHKTKTFGMFRYCSKLRKGSKWNRDRNYFRCSSEGCNVKKRVERDREDSRFVITTYEGIHNHRALLPAISAPHPTIGRPHPRSFALGVKPGRDTCHESMEREVAPTQSWKEAAHCMQTQVADTEKLLYKI